jgi:hypothetical protein
VGARPSKWSVSPFTRTDLWRLVGGYSGDRVRCECVAVLVPEPENPYDCNAIKVLIDGWQVGHLSREDAAVYLAGLHHLLSNRTEVALRGHIVGGGEREGRLGLLGVFLDHNPGDFGLRITQVAHIGELRTGLSQAIATDLEDDSYDLSWLDRLSGNSTPADAVIVRKLLSSERDPIDRHFMFGEPGKCLYKGRDAFASALDEFDEVCEQHDAEMGVIRVTLMAKFGAMPVVDMYRQAAIRCQKARNWEGMRHWTDRGLLVHGTACARVEAVADLQKRLAYAEAKLAAPVAGPRRRARVSREESMAVVEQLVCSHCGENFERIRSRGRKPLRCPACR